MSWFLKICVMTIAVGVLAPSVASAKEKTPPASTEEVSDTSAPHDRSFEETREFMRKHSEESKRTGKM